MTGFETKIAITNCLAQPHSSFLFDQTTISGLTPLVIAVNPGFDAARKNLKLAFKNQHPQCRATSLPCTPHDAYLEGSLSPPPHTPHKECIGSSDSDVVSIPLSHKVNEASHQGLVIYSAIKRAYLLDKCSLNRYLTTNPQIMRGSSTSSSASGSFGQCSTALKKRNIKKESSDELSKIQSSPRSTFAAKLFKRKSNKDPISPTRPQSEIFPERKVEVPTRSYSAAPKVF